jgi:hypothetical protein
MAREMILVPKEKYTQLLQMREKLSSKQLVKSKEEESGMETVEEGEGINRHLKKFKGNGKHSSQQKRKHEKQNYKEGSLSERSLQGEVKIKGGGRSVKRKLYEGPPGFMSVKKRKWKKY